MGFLRTGTLICHTFYSTGCENKTPENLLNEKLQSLHYCFLWLYSPLGPWPPPYRRFLELFRHKVGLLGRVISPSLGFYLHRTTRHRKTRDKHPCLERDSNPRSQQPTGQDPRLRSHGHCDRLLYYLLNIIKGGQINKSKIGRACSTYERNIKCVHSFGRKAWKEDTTLKKKPWHRR
jgi:hypothetical protein